jgi:hypothetical protein
LLKYKGEGMRKVRRLLIAAISALAVALVPSAAIAHPGATDAQGGHTCRTNCEQYGLDYGEYHTHSGSGNGGSTSGTSNGNAGTSVVTQADCDARRIRRGGRTLTREECQRLIGQRVSLASTGFEAWMFAAAGSVCLLIAIGLRRSRPRGGRAI